MQHVQVLGTLEGPPETKRSAAGVTLLRVVDEGTAVAIPEWLPHQPNALFERAEFFSDSERED